jgi:hypothetical protein
MNPVPPPKKDDRQLNPSGKPPLSEKDFIQNGWSLTSLPFWLWLALLATLAAIIWGSRGWYEGFIQKEKRHDPFLEVTNREFSLFLWQFPSFLRVNVPKKSGYLPGFLANSENFNLTTAEDYVSAPPDLIFLYHIWHRLLSPEFIPRPISPTEFDDFLQQLPEWQPKNWKSSLEEYTQLVDSKSYLQIENLQTLPEKTLPQIVRQAFQGWKNYFLEGPRINEVHPTFAQIIAFLEQHPHYARNFWRNIEVVHGQEVAGSKYLIALLKEKETQLPDAPFPIEQLAPFLKVALFNFEQAQQNR